MILNLLLLQKEISRIAIQAGEAIMSFYRDEALWANKDADFFALKEDKTPVTKADQAADMLIVSALNVLTPDIPVLSEEGRQELESYTLAWIVDPLDGTRQFVQRQGYFTVNIGLLQAGKPILGIVYEPVSGAIYSGYAGQKKPMMPQEKKALKICHGSFTKDVNLLESLTRFCLSKGFDIHTELISSSFKYCLVASQEFDAAMSIHKMSSWDIVAAHAVVCAAGGVMGIWDPDHNCLKTIDYQDLLDTNADLPPGVTALSQQALRVLGF